MTKLRVLLTITAVLYGMAFFDGFLGLGLSDGLYILSGLGQIVCIVWALVIVYKNDSVTI